MNAEAAEQSLPRVDAVGIGMSALCGVHCVLWPFALSALPVLGIDLGHAGHGHSHGAFEWTMIGLITALAGYAAYRGWSAHRSLAPAVLMAAGLAVFLLIRPELHHAGWIEHAATVAGGSLLISGHWLNSRKAKACRRCAIA